MAELYRSLKLESTVGGASMKKFFRCFLLFFCLASGLIAQEAAFVKLNFVIDEDCLAAHMLSQLQSIGIDKYLPYLKKALGEELVRSFQEEVYQDITDDEWEVLHKNYRDFLCEAKPFETLETRFILQKCKSHPFFTEALHQTEEFLERCQSWWEENYDTTLSLMQEMTGIPFHEEFTVYIIHPTFGMGMSSSVGCLFWGCDEKWPNYSVVYLWHEIMHQYFPYDHLSHVIIQFLTDNELRVRLDTAASYPPFEGHRYLLPMMEAMQEEWLLYLASENKDIYDFAEKLEERFSEVKDAL